MLIRFDFVRYYNYIKRDLNAYTGNEGKNGELDYYNDD